MTELEHTNSPGGPLVTGNARTASLERTTGETSVSVSINLDGQGRYDVVTGNGFLDHMVGQIARHGLIDITLKAKGDVHTGWHHLVEDVGIMLGRAFREALGDGLGIRRMGHAIVPLDEALALVAVDCGGPQPRCGGNHPGRHHGGDPDRRPGRPLFRVLRQRSANQPAR